MSQIIKKTLPYNTLIWITIYSIAMGLFESAVVIYIRAIYYPEGFDFPMKIIDSTISITEIFREIATIIMLVSMAAIAGKNFIQRFAYFILSFAIWDIFYYIFLYWLIDWPSSIFTFDVLFLIPMPWIGTVITPIIISSLMIFLAIILIKFDANANNFKLKWKSWILLITGSIVTIFSWIYDYMKFILERYDISEIWNINTTNKLFEAATSYVPQTFNYYIFFFGVAIILAGIIQIIVSFKQYERRKI